MHQCNEGLWGQFSARGVDSVRVRDGQLNRRRLQESLRSATEKVLHPLLRTDLYPSAEILQEVGCYWHLFTGRPRWHPSRNCCGFQITPRGKQQPSPSQKGSRIGSNCSESQCCQSAWATPPKQEIQPNGNWDGQVPRQEAFSIQGQGEIKRNLGFEQRRGEKPVRLCKFKWEPDALQDQQLHLTANVEIYVRDDPARGLWIACVLVAAGRRLLFVLSLLRWKLQPFRATDTHRGLLVWLPAGCYWRDDACLLRPFQRDHQLSCISILLSIRGGRISKDAPERALGNGRNTVNYDGLSKKEHALINKVYDHFLFASSTTAWILPSLIPMLTKWCSSSFSVIL